MSFDCPKRLQLISMSLLISALKTHFSFTAVPLFYLFFTTKAIKMQSLRNDGLGGRGVTYIPSSGTYGNVVIWMHGLGTYVRFG